MRELLGMLVGVPKNSDATFPVKECVCCVCAVSFRIFWGGLLSREALEGEYFWILQVDYKKNVHNFLYLRVTKEPLLINLSWCKKIVHSLSASYPVI